MTCIWKPPFILPLFASSCWLRVRRLHSSSSCIQRLSYSSASDIKVPQYLKARIKSNGPISVAEYMKIVLTSTESGYYMHRDVFGSKGDFITSPEISQMFGEMIGVWCVNEWNNLCSGQSVQIVELGPGRGTLADDLLRVFSKFPHMKEKISLHLVEISPALSQLQAQHLTNNPKSVDLGSHQILEGPDLGPYRHETSKYGPDIFWYRSLQDVPRKMSIYLAHEFLDALPVHKFQKTEKGWREVLVDLKADEGQTHSEKSPFQFVLSSAVTPALTFLEASQGDTRSHVEVCPQAGQIVQEVAHRIKKVGGFGLFVDYGHTGEKEDTFRAFKQHELHDPLVEPGSADLTADVDFAYLKQCIKDVVTFGPINQHDFLINMGIGVRLMMLLEKAKADQRKSLQTGYDMLINPDKMGERFKFLALMDPSTADYVPAGFHVPEGFGIQF